MSKSSISTTNPNRVHVGYISDAHGIKGELYIVLFNERPGWVDGCELLFLTPRSGGAETSLEVERSRFHKKGMIVSSKQVLDRNHAEELKGQSVFVDKMLLSTQADEDMYLAEMQGFEVIVCGESLGKIQSFTDNGAQDLLVVVSPSGQSYEIPFVDEFIEKIDRETSQVKMILPPGLLELSQT